jgi:hypothetical protein
MATHGGTGQSTDRHQPTAWRTTRRGALKVGALAGASLAVPWRADAATYTSLPARQADSIADAYGVCIHLPHLDTPYLDELRVADAITNLGARHVRDDLYLDNPRQYAGIAALYARGIDFNLVMGRPDRPGTPLAYALAAAALPPGAIASLEGVNEWDLFGRGRANWVDEVVTWQKDLYAAANTVPTLANLPVLSPSMAFRQNYQHLPDLSPWADVANAHMYPGGYKPGTEIDNITAALRKVVATEPIVTTETGYHNATATTSGHNPVSERAGGFYAPRLLLEHIRRGHARTFSYELIDQFNDTQRTNPEANFGLLRRDWSPKPAYTATQRLLRLVADPGGAFTPKPLSLAASGWPADGRYVLTQKRNGSYVLLIWRDVSVWDVAARKDVSVPAASITYTFPRRYKMVVDSINGSTRPTVKTGTSLKLSVGGGVFAITLTPA